MLPCMLLTKLYEPPLLHTYKKCLYILYTVSIYTNISSMWPYNVMFVGAYQILLVKLSQTHQYQLLYHVVLLINFFLRSTTKKRILCLGSITSFFCLCTKLTLHILLQKVTRGLCYACTLYMSSYTFHKIFIRQGLLHAPKRSITILSVSVNPIVRSIFIRNTIFCQIN